MAFTLGLDLKKNTGTLLENLEYYIIRSLKVDEPLDSQCNNIEQYLKKKGVIFEKLISYKEEVKRYGKRFITLHEVKYKIHDDKETAFFRIKQEICNFVENEKVVYISYEIPTLNDYAIIENEELDMPIEEMLRKRVSVLCMNSASGMNPDETIVYSLRNYLIERNFQVKYNINEGFVWKNKEKKGTQYIENYSFDIMVNNQTFKVRLQQDREISEWDTMYKKAVLDSIERQNYLLN